MPITADDQSVTPAESHDQTQREVLGFLLGDRDQSRCKIEEICRAVTGGANDWAKDDDVQNAIRDLAGAGLVHLEEDEFVSPTRAARYYCNLQGGWVI